MVPALLLSACVCLASCGAGSGSSPDPGEVSAGSGERVSGGQSASESAGLSAVSGSGGESGTITERERGEMKMTIGATEVTVAWEDNESVAALKELCGEGPLTLQMSMYGGFEQVGPLGTDLPRQDVQTVTEAGDIVLYCGNQIVVFYGSNSWAYTRLGHITDRTAQEMTDLLSQGDVTITITGGNER